MLDEKTRAFLSCCSALAARTCCRQNRGEKISAAKSFTISGRVSEDGKTLIAKGGESWLVTNPDVLASHARQQVKVKCETSAGHSIRVFSLKILAPPATYHANPGDSVFRR